MTIRPSTRYGLMKHLTFIAKGILALAVIGIVAAALSAVVVLIGCAVFWVLSVLVGKQVALFALPAIIIGWMAYSFGKMMNDDN